LDIQYVKNISTSENNKYICECGWNISSKELHLTYKDKQLIGASIFELAFYDDITKIKNYEDWKKNNELEDKIWKNDKGI